MTHRNGRGRQQQTPVMRMLNGLVTVGLAAAVGVAAVMLVFAVVLVIRLYIWGP